MDFVAVDWHTKYEAKSWRQIGIEIEIHLSDFRNLQNQVRADVWNARRPGVQTALATVLINIPLLGSLKTSVALFPESAN